MITSVGAAKSPLTRAEADYKTLEFFDAFASIEMKSFAGVSLGVERRFNTDDRTGFCLLLEDQMVHLNALRVAG